jgi:hypothetical protein
MLGPNGRRFRGEWVADRHVPFAIAGCKIEERYVLLPIGIHVPQSRPV